MVEREIYQSLNVSVTEGGNSYEVFFKDFLHKFKEKNSKERMNKRKKEVQKNRLLKLFF